VTENDNNIIKFAAVDDIFNALGQNTLEVWAINGQDQQGNNSQNFANAEASLLTNVQAGQADRGSGLTQGHFSLVHESHQVESSSVAPVAGSANGLHTTQPGAIFKRVAKTNHQAAVESLFADWEA
jgi:hypothetical protein